jgi:hypothetical protein
MIVINKDMNRTEHVDTHFVELFKKELEAYCSYKDIAEATDDYILELALNEIMEDEYLHAKFLRNFMMEHNTYPLDENDEWEKKFIKIHKKMVM